MKYILIKILPANYSLATDIVKLIRYHDELIQCTGKYLSKYICVVCNRSSSCM